jgi:hypothetical protein
MRLTTIPRDLGFEGATDAIALDDFPDGVILDHLRTVWAEAGDLGLAEAAELELASLNELYIYLDGALRYGADFEELCAEIARLSYSRTVAADLRTLIFGRLEYMTYVTGPRELVSAYLETKIAILNALIVEKV